MTLTLTWPRMVGMVLRKILDQYVSSYQRWIKSVISLGNNEVLKTLTKTLTFVDVDANANAAANANTNANADIDAEGGTIPLRERCSGELKREGPYQTATSLAILGLYCPHTCMPRRHLFSWRRSNIFWMNSIYCDVSVHMCSSLLACAIFTYTKDAHVLL